VRAEEYLARFPALSAAIVDQLSIHEIWSTLADAPSPARGPAKTS
jgi:hypothetical protein